MATRPSGHVLIDGTWSRGTGAEREVRSPASGEVIGAYAAGTPADIDQAVGRATVAQRSWAAETPFTRAAILHAVAREIRSRQNAFAMLLSLENGKPLRTEAMGEIEWAANQIDEAAEWAVRVEGAILPSASPTKRVLVRREPRGVAGVITPWNHPVMIPCEYLGPALATGNAVVWVPAPSVVLCAAELAACFVAAGLPPGLLALVPGPGAVVGDALAGHPGIDIVGLTGSTATGRTVAQRATGRPMILELGGNGPTLVLPDADVARAASGIAAGAFANAGQSCSSTELVIAHRSIRPRLVEALREQAASIVLGDPLEEATTMGPLHNDAVAAQVERQVEAAIAGGARAIAGGRRRAGMPTALYFEPTLLDGVDPAADVAREETFGPVIPVVEVDSDEAALEVAAASGYGLIAAVYGEDLGRATRVAEQVRAGIVNVNDTSDYWELHIPFGGASGTRSGTGRIGGRATAEAFTETRTLIVETSRADGA